MCSSDHSSWWWRVWLLCPQSNVFPGRCRLQTWVSPCHRWAGIYLVAAWTGVLYEVDPEVIRNGAQVSGSYLVFTQRISATTFKKWKESTQAVGPLGTVPKGNKAGTHLKQSTLFSAGAIWLHAPLTSESNDILASRNSSLQFGFIFSSFFSLARKLICGSPNIIEGWSMQQAYHCPRARQHHYHS